MMRLLFTAALNIAAEMLNTADVAVCKDELYGWTARLVTLPPCCCTCERNAHSIIVYSTDGQA